MNKILSVFIREFRWLMALLVLLLWGGSARATHIRAAEITVERISNVSPTYRFTVTAVRDSESTIPFGQGVFDFGDGTFLDGDFDPQITPLGDFLELNVFVVEHTYSSESGRYIISYREENRNADILNMDNSVNTPFYVESQIWIDPFFGVNNSPIMTVLPIDKGGQFVKFFHNAGAFDPDGDSLSYEITTPRQDVNVDVFGYVLPNDPRFYNDFTRGNETQTDVPTFTLDPITGTLEWDAPGEPGEYNVAFRVIEWRKIQGEWFRLGFVTRDMQIIIEPTFNDKPELQIPDDICVEAGQVVNEIVRGTDPDGHPVRIEAFGGPFEIPSPATLSPDLGGNFTTSPAASNFVWQTTCGHVRERPYEVIFKITDNPISENETDINGPPVGPRLVNFETWFVTVVGPAPTGLETATQPGRAINVSWDPYVCEEADSIQVWRRVDSYQFDVDDCQVGMPAFAGYELIDVISTSNNSYLDNDQGRGLAPGATYCYRLVASFPQPAGGLSYVSMEVCDSLEANGPVITKVDIETTDRENGMINLEWVPPFDLETSVYPQPFQYDVIRATGLEGVADQTQVASLLTNTSFVDTDLNTLDRGYNYKIILKDGNGVIIDSSAVASSVRLELEPLFESIELRWGANVPWSNRSQDYPYHYIFRNRVSNDEDELVLIDSVDVGEGGFFYMDDGRFNDEKLSDKLEYCYYVTTQGVYGNPNIDEPLINRSQLICGQPNDTISPCTPVAFAFDPLFNCESLVANQSCDFSDFRNHLLWEQDGNSECENDIREYNIYFSESGDPEEFVLIGSSIDTEFFHEDLPSLKGCYRITSVDRSGNESQPTETICADNCPQYILPNAFSPNDDGINDFFTPLYSGGDIRVEPFDTNNCPRFVKSVIFKVFDRTGNELFDFDSNDIENSILINWDGKTKNGVALPPGTYFYTADVVFDVLDTENNKERIKGYVQLLK